MAMERILIVDDEVDLARGITRTLQREFRDMEIFSASSGEEALDFLNREPVDAALVDIRMPGMSGLELLERMRAKDEQVTASLISSR